MKTFLAWLIPLLTLRPHFIVGSREKPYLLRWMLFPRNRWANVYLHKFCRSDDDRALHDHPWPSLSILFWGGYFEETHGPGGPTGRRRRERFFAPAIIRRSPNYTHRIVLVDDLPAWTLFFVGPRVREWGFHCPHGWIRWTNFVADHGDVHGIGPGCEAPADAPLPAYSKESA